MTINPTTGLTPKEDEMDTKIRVALESLAKNLGTTAEKIFSYYVKNVKLYILYYFIYLALSILISVAGGLMTFIPLHGESIENLCGGSALVFSIGIILFIGGMTGFLITVFSIPDLITAIKNPEYKATEDLFGTLFQ